MKQILRTWMALAVLLALLPGSALAGTITVDAAKVDVEESGWYDSMEEVAVYLTFFEELPDNYLTKREAQDVGWDSREGNLWEVAYGCSIGGDTFGNREGLLPKAKGRKWTECDIDYEGGFRNAERIVFSNDGLIYYTDDHYASFDEVEVVWLDDEKEQSDDTWGESAYEEEPFLTDDDLEAIVDWLFGG